MILASLKNVTQKRRFLIWDNRGIYIIFDIKSQKGVTMIEYALIAALVAVVAIAALTAVGTKLTAIFTQISTTI